MGQFSLFEQEEPRREPEAEESRTSHPPAPAASEAPPVEAVVEEVTRPRYRTEVKLDWYMGKVAAVVRTNLPGVRPEQYEEFDTPEEAKSVYGWCRLEEGEDGSHEVTVWWCGRKLEAWQ